MFDAWTPKTPGLPELTNNPEFAVKSILKGLALLLFAAEAIFSAQACSVYLALNQPSLKDLSVLGPEGSEKTVVRELGSPIWSGQSNQEKIAIYKFQQGYTTLSKRARAIFYAIADIASLGIWEIPGTLIEKYGLRAVPMTAKVQYGTKGEVRSAEIFEADVVSDRRALLRSGSIGLAIAPNAPKELQTPTKGRLASTGRGVVAGWVWGSTAGAPLLWAPPAAILVGVGGAVIGSVTGAIYGAAAGESTSSLEQKDLILNTALQNVEILEIVRDEIAFRLGELRFNPIAYLANEELLASKIEDSYPVYDHQGIKTIIELSPVLIELRNVGLGINPEKQLVLTVSARLMRTIDGFEVAYWYVTHEESGSHSLDTWAAEDGRLFREKVIQASHQLGDRVTKYVVSRAS